MGVVWDGVLCMGVACRDHEFARLLVLVYLLHLLDFDWQDYDHALLNELNLTELYVSNAISESALCHVT